MPTKPKHNYDIDKIQALENEGNSIRGVARILGLPEVSTQAWIKRNYNRVVVYIKK